VVDAFLAAVSDPANSPVYIHCGSANRVGAVWLVKRMLVDGWDERRALAEAEAIGLKNAALRDFMLAYVREHQRK
jgi:protein tyrosine/serine phosphatase